MASNQSKIRSHYSANPAREDARNRRSRVAGIEPHCTKLLLGPYITPESSVVEFGCATGYYAEHWHEKCKSYLGVDIVPEHVDFFNGKHLSNAKAQLGDATSCSELPDASFDVVLCLGPMYHLPPQERALAMSEMARICKPGGVLAFAYCNTMGVLVAAMVDGYGSKNLPWYRRRKYSYYPNAAGNAVMRTGENDIDKPFYFTMPEDMAALAGAHGLQVLRNAAVDVLLNTRRINAMPEEQFALWMEIAEEILKYPSCAGMSNHGLLICRN